MTPWRCHSCLLVSSVVVCQRYYSLQRNCSFVFLKIRVLPLCNACDENNPLLNSGLIMDDDASIHRGPEIKELCSRFGVRLEFLPPYLLDYNPIEQSFAELKAWMPKNRPPTDSYNDNLGGACSRLVI
jgi:hypothetical protein